MVKAAVRVIPKADAARFQAGLWVPKQDSTLLIELPGERLLANVARVVNPDLVICELINMPLQTKFHRYEKGEFVPCERTQTELETIWRAFRPAPAPPSPPPRSKTRRRRKH